jgi:hypothetical protein
MRKILTLPLAVSLLALAPAAATAAPPAQVIVLPGASGAEGIAAGKGTTFYAGDLVRGDIFVGDVRRGTAELLIDAPDDGRPAVGLATDLRHDLLFVGGGGSGQGYVYNTRTRQPVASYDFGDPATTMVNDAVVTPAGAWFTNSLAAQLFFVPVVCGVPGPARTLEVTGPAAAIMGFNLNGIEATPSGETLIVAHNALGKLFTVDPRTGASAEIAGVAVPGADGIVLDDRRIWVVQAFRNQVTEWRLSADLSSGTLTELITDPLFRVPTTVARFGSRLALVNSHFDTGVPPNSPTYEVIVRLA